MSDHRSDANNDQCKNTDLAISLLCGRGYFAECGLRKMSRVICGKSSAERSANYPLWLFCIAQLKNSAFPWITKLPFACIVQLMCSRSIGVMSDITWCLPSVFFAVRLTKNRVVFLQFLLTSNSVPHSKYHIISLVNVIGFNLYNRCDSCRDDRMN